jgi:hypothetical protein
VSFPHHLGRLQDKPRLNGCATAEDCKRALGASRPVEIGCCVVGEVLPSVHNSLEGANPLLHGLNSFWGWEEGTFRGTARVG